MVSLFPLLSISTISYPVVLRTVTWRIALRDDKEENNKSNNSFFILISFLRIFQPILAVLPPPNPRFLQLLIIHRYHFLILLLNLDDLLHNHSWVLILFYRLVYQHDKVQQGPPCEFLIL